MVELRRANPCDYIRFVFSILILVFSIICTSYAIVMQQTGFWKAVPGWAALILFIIDLILLGIVEGLQIALVELKRQHPDSYKVTHPMAHRLGQVALVGDNVERFLMGRQVCVVFLVFFSAKLTTLHLEEGEKFLFPVPQWVESAFFETGFLACIVVVIVAQLMPQIAAAKYPVHFMQFFIMRPAYYFCIFLEITGLTHACWLLSGLMQRMFRMEDDDTTKNPNEYICPEEIIMEVEANLDATDMKDGSSSGISTRGSSEDSTSDRLAFQQQDQEKHTNLEFSRLTNLVETIDQTVSPDTLRVLRHYLDNHPEQFQSYPSIVGNKMYAAPHELAQQIKEDGHEVPRFLTAINDPDHIPPHIVACELLSQNRDLREEINLLRAKLDARE